MPIKRSRREIAVYTLFTAPILVLYVVFFMLPLGMGFYYSMTDWNGISQKFNFIAWENFRLMLQDHRVLNSLQFSLRYAFLLVIVVNILALLIGLILNSRLKGTYFFRALFFFPAVISLIVVGLVFDQILYHAVPRIGKFLEIDILKRNLLGNKDTVFWVVLMVSVWRETAVPMVLILAGLQTVPQELLEASTLEGASAFTQFKSITFPFLIPVFSMNLVLTVKSGIMVYDIIKALTGGGPGIATESIGILIYKKGFEEFQFGFASALSFLLFAMVAVISVIQIYFLRSREAGQI